MKFLKGMGLGLVGFLLLISLPLLGLAIMLNITFLNPQFIYDEIEKMDINAIAHQLLAQQLDLEEQTYLPAVDKTLVQIKPWTDQQIHNLVFGIYDYLQGKTQELKITISTSAIQPILVNNLTEAYLSSPPTGFQQLTPNQQSQAIAQYQQQVEDILPASILIDKDLVGAEGMQGLNQAKEIIGSIRTAYYALIAATIILVFLMILILREKKAVTRSLGILLMIEGILETAAYFLAKQTVPLVPSGYHLPSALQTGLVQFINDFTFPFGVFSIVLLGAGIILFTVSFFFKAPHPAGVTNPT